MSVLLPWIFLILFVAACGLGGWAFWVWWKRPRYTRERFAFVGLSSLVGLVTLYISSFSLGESALTLISHILFQPFGIDVPTLPLFPVGAVLFPIVLSVLAYVFVKIFINWDGQKSVAQQEQAKDSATTFNSELYKESQLSQSDTETPTTVLKRPESIAWHQRVQELWKLRHRSYLFENEYDPAYGWLGEEKNIGSVVLLACFIDSPPESKIQELAEYARQKAKHDDKVQFELILAVKNKAEHELKSQYCDFKLTYTSEAELLENLVNFDDYFDYIRKQVKYAKLPGSDWTLQDMYEPSRYRIHKADDAKAETTEDFIFKWLAENTQRQLAVLGEYGQGKSTLSLLLCYQLINKYKINATVRIPILIELRGKTLRTLSPEDLLAMWSRKHHIDPQALLHLHHAGRLLQIFEGFDEIDLSGDTEARIAHFHTLWGFNHNHAKFIITGRPNFFLDSEELRRALGDTQQSHTLHLEPFNLRQIENCLRKVKLEIRSGIIKLAEKDEKFREVVARPSLLYIVALLWETENLSGRDHLNSADVIDLFIKHSLQRQQTKQDDRKFMVLNSAERRYFMMGIAAYMAAKQLPNQINKLQLEEAVNLLVDAIPDAVSRQVTAASGEDSRPLRSEERLAWKTKLKEIMERINTDVRACGLLVTDVSKDGAFKFAHKSYIELLQAQVIYQSYFATKDVEQQAVQSLSNRLNLESGILQKSSEVFDFFTECLASHFQQQGIKDETSIANSKHLWQILVRGRLSRPMFLISAAMGLVNQVSKFGVEPRHIILFALFIPYLAHLIYLIPSTGLDAVMGAVMGAVVGGGGVVGAVVGGIVVEGGIVVVLVGLVVVGGSVGLGVDFLEKLSFSRYEAIIVASLVVLISFLVGLVLGLALDVTRSEPQNPISKRLHLWYRACKSLNLSQESIEKVAGKGMARLLAEREEKR